jgi:hypothetical protein
MEILFFKIQPMKKSQLLDSSELVLLKNRLEMYRSVNLENVLKSESLIHSTFRVKDLKVFEFLFYFSRLF